MLGAKLPKGERAASSKHACIVNVGGWQRKQTVMTFLLWFFLGELCTAILPSVLNCLVKTLVYFYI